MSFEEKQNKNVSSQIKNKINIFYKVPFGLPRDLVAGK
jgi:hypothetical protein